MPYYEFVVRGEVDADTLEQETGLSCTVVDRAVRLGGDLIDRAALHGIIERMYRLGLDLVTVERRSPRHAP
jgi:hypothetical protein